MTEHELCIEARFRGPPDSGNGGYSAGLVARHFDTLVEVRLLAPPPLDTPLRLVIDDAGRGELSAGGQRIARAAPVDWHLEVPGPPSLEAAREARKRYRGFEHHPLPGCFVCGTDRAPGDGLNVFAGPLADRPELVACPWEVHEGLPAAGGVVNEEIVFAALDCPGYAGVRDAANFALLGAFSARVFRPVHLGESLVATGWALGTEGRRHRAGTALFDPDGGLVAAALATWVSVPEADFLASLR